MKNELSAGTTDEQRTDADSIPSASLAQNGMLPAVFDSLQQYVIERKEKYFVLKLPLSVQIDFNRDLILNSFNDVVVHYTSGDNFQTIEVFEK